ncbi:Vesicle-fusing, partial [Brachionus plicatilis]
MTVEVDFIQKKVANLDPYDTDLRISATRNQQKNAFSNTADLSAAIDGKASRHAQIKSGQLLPNSAIIFERVEGSSLNLTGKCKGKVQAQSIINPDWDFTKIGIGGLDKEFNTIFRRAFASRVFPPELIEQLNIKHVRGILLFGPPGTGKTLMARQIGKMLNAKEPKI